MKNKITYLHWKFQLIIQFRNKKIMTESLSHLHYSYNSSINLVLSVLEYSFSCANLFLDLKNNTTPWIITFHYYYFIHYISAVNLSNERKLILVQLWDRCRPCCMLITKWLWRVLLLKQARYNIKDNVKKKIMSYFKSIW